MTHPRAVQKFGAFGADPAAMVKRCRNGRLQTISNWFQPLLAIDHFDGDVACHDTSKNDRDSSNITGRLRALLNLLRNIHSIRKKLSV
jgi:hypothetical protein